MKRLVLSLSLSGALLLPAPATGQTCAEPHYRWSEKTDTALATRPATPVTIGEILTNWTPLRLTRTDICAHRAGREDSVFTTVAWIRRLRLHEADGDWHIELTDQQTTPVTACVIAEIPAATYGAVYGQARSALASLVDTTRLGGSGDVAPAVVVRLTGAAFFDGYHQARPTGGGPARASGHGRCNASLRALWELHPVYKVQAPGP